jgi:penicillin-binding protein
MRLSKTLVIILTIFISLFIFVGCNSKNDVEDKLNNVISLLNDEKYDEFYEMLSSKSKDYIEEEFGGKEGFINKYDSIYSAIGISNINIKIKEYSNKSEIPMYMTIDTIGGKLEYEDFKINLVKEGKDYKIVWDESLILPEMIQGDKVRVKITSGSRGRILDRNQNPLAYNGEVKLININKSLFENNKEENIKDLAKILDINEDYIQNKLDENEDELIFLVKLSNYEDEKLENVSKINGIVVQNSISRVYKSGEAFGSLLGYIGNITSEELENSQGKGYTSISQIGKNGL